MVQLDKSTILRNRLTHLKVEGRKLQAKLDELRVARDLKGMRKVRDELERIARESRGLLCMVGKYRFPENEVIEYEPGKFMSANIYYMLKRD